MQKTPDTRAAETEHRSRLWETGIGALVLELEQQLLHEPLRRMHGETVVWSSDHIAGGELLSRCMVRHALCLSRSGGRSGGRSGARSEGQSAEANFEPVDKDSALVGTLEQLPFSTSSVNGMVLHHSLETVMDPRIALREVTRVLAPGARLVIVGFNPFSMVGLRATYNRWVEGPLSGHKLVNPLRLFDWLAVLGYELQATPVYLGFGLPIRSSYEPEEALTQSRFPRLARWQQEMMYGPIRAPFGGVLLLEAVKQTAARSQPWPQVKSRAQLAPVSYPRVAQWQRKPADAMRASGMGPSSMGPSGEGQPS